MSKRKKKKTEMICTEKGRGGKKSRYRDEIPKKKKKKFDLVS